jgi:ribosome-binding factor A
MNNPNRRSRRFADQLKYEIGWIIERQVNDPKKGFLTLTRVRMSPDLRIANVYFSVLGEENQKNDTLEVLNKAKKYIRKELGTRIEARFLPELRFHFDDSLEYSSHINSILQKIQGENDNK